MQLTPYHFFQQSIHCIEIVCFVAVSTNSAFKNVLACCRSIEPSMRSSGRHDFCWNHINRALSTSGCLLSLLHLLLARELPSELWAWIFSAFFIRSLKVCSFMLKYAATFFFFTIGFSSTYCKIFNFSARVLSWWLCFSSLDIQTVDCSIQDKYMAVK